MDINTKSMIQSNLQEGMAHSAVFNKLLDMSTDGIFRVDRNLKYQYVNSAMSSMFGICSGQCIDEMNAELLMPKEMDNAWTKAIRLVFELGNEQTLEYRSMHGQRQYFLHLHYSREINGWEHSCRIGYRIRHQQA